MPHEEENEVYEITPGDTSTPESASRNSIQQDSTNDAGTATPQHAHDGDTEGSATQATQATGGDNTRPTIVPSHYRFDIGHGDTPGANAVEFKPEGTSVNESNGPPTLSQEGTDTMQNVSSSPSSDVIKHPIPESQPPDSNNNAADISPLTTGQSSEENIVTDDTEHPNDNSKNTTSHQYTNDLEVNNISLATDLTPSKVIDSGMQATDTGDNMDGSVMVSIRDMIIHIPKRSSIVSGTFVPSSSESNLPSKPSLPSATTDIPSDSSIISKPNLPSTTPKPCLPSTPPESNIPSTIPESSEVVTNDNTNEIPTVNQVSIVFLCSTNNCLILLV